MTPEEVVACEAAAGFEIQVNESTQKYTPYYGLWGKGTSAGVENARIDYTFSSDGLIQVGYQFFGDDTFNTMEKALTEKYGEAEYSYITRKKRETMDIGAHYYVFNGKSSKWSHRIAVISDSLVIAISHHLDEITLPKDTIVYTVLSMGDAESLSEEAMNDL